MFKFVWYFAVFFQHVSLKSQEGRVLIIGFWHFWLGGSQLLATLWWLGEDGAIHTPSVWCPCLAPFAGQ